MFDFEKIDAYKCSLIALDSAVAISEDIPRGHRQFADQLNRAASSVCLNISEGVGEFKPLEKVRFYRMALRSISESVSVVQILHRLKIIDEEEYLKIYHQFTRTSKVLTKLIQSVERRS